MVRGWILLSVLTLGVIFKLWPDYGGEARFPFSNKVITTQLYVYYFMEHLIAVAIAACFLIHDNTPRALFWLFFAIICLDLVHYILFFRDEGIGFNLAKVAVLGFPLLYLELKGLWEKYNPS